MSALPGVTVLIVNFRTPALTTAAAESALDSLEVLSDVIIVDNDSADGSAERLRAQFCHNDRVTLLTREVNGGYTAGNNAGVAVARSQGASLLCLLNSDAVLAPDCLRAMVEEMDGDPRIALVSPRIFLGSDPDLLWFGGATYSRWSACPTHVGFGRPASDGWTQAADLPFASGCILLMRLSAIPGAPFDESLFAYAEDLDLAIRIRESGLRVRYTPRANGWHFANSSHRGEQGRELRSYLNTRNLLRVNARHARWYHWPVLFPVLLVNVVLRFCALAIRDSDSVVLQAVLRGAWHALRGGLHPVERTSDRS